MFAGVIMIMVGCFQAIAGLAAHLRGRVLRRDAELHLRGRHHDWGWIHLILGLVVAFAGYALFAGKTWARVIGVTSRC